MSKLRSISSVLQNCLAFQESSYWFADIPAIQRIVTEMPTFSEEAAHAASLELEPRAPAPDEAGQSFAFFVLLSNVDFLDVQENSGGRA